jgi:hypothetical protein
MQKMEFEENPPDLVDDYDSDVENESNKPSLFTPVESATTNPEKDFVECKVPRHNMTFDEVKAEKLNYEKINEYLESIKRTAYQCCSFACYSWLTLTMILACRSEYLLIENHKNRTLWLEDRLQQMEDTSKKRLLYAYYVETTDEVASQPVKKRCCREAWNFTYGVSERTKARASRSRKGGHKKPVSSTKKLAKENRKRGLTHKEMYCASWLKRFAQTFGDVLPFGDQDTVPEIRVPFGKKKMVYQCYVDSFNSNPTNLGLPCTYPDFISTWKNREDLQHIKCAKYKPGFAKCDVCDTYSERTKKQLDPVVREQLDLEFNAHLYEERLEREQYYAARNKAADKPEKFMSIILDAMDQKKTCIPYFLNPPKSLGSDYFMKTKLTAAIVHGHGSYVFWSIHSISLLRR